jgi:MFS family permease
MGTWLQQVAMGWLAYRLSGSAWLLGVIGFCSNIPILLLAPLAGIVSDRGEKRRLLLTTQSVMLTQAVALAVLTASGTVTVWHLIVLAILLGLASSFDLPLRQSLIADLLEDKAHLPNAIALNSFMVNSARVVGPALAGILVAAFGEAVCFALNALSFVFVLAALLRMRWTARRPAAATAGFLESWREGARYAFGFMPIRMNLLMVAVLSFTVAPYSTLMPVFARDVYGGNAETLGLLLSSAGAGALVGTVYLASRTSVRGLYRLIPLAAATAGLCLTAFSQCRVLPLAMLLMLFVGGGMIMTAASTNTILQTIVDHDKRGRLMSFYITAFLGVAPFGNLAAGALVNAIGEQWTFTINGLVCALAAGWFYRRLPEIRTHIRPVYERLGIIPSLEQPR